MKHFSQSSRAAGAAALMAGLTGLLAPSVSAQVECSIPMGKKPILVSGLDDARISLQPFGSAYGYWYTDDVGHPVVIVGSDWFYAELTREGALEPTEWRVDTHDPWAVGIRPLTSREEVRSAPGIDRRQIQGRQGSERAGQGGGGAFGDLDPSSRGTAHLATTGTAENLVVMLRFSDHGSRIMPSESVIDAILNGSNYSVRDYYLEVSYGQLTINSDVQSWVTVSNTEPYYADGNSGFPSSFMAELLHEALDLVDPYVDFSNFDQNADGEVDMITFLHSGYAAEFPGNDEFGAGPSDRIWSHRGTISSWTSAEGVKVKDYVITSALRDLAGLAPLRIGTTCHELGHSLGLPDLYDTDDSSLGIGNWGLMASGGWDWNGDQEYPSHPCAWSKVKMGWVEPELILPGAHIVERVETSQSILLVESGYPPGEYLLLENRHPYGYDRLAPGTGVAVWHIDEAKGHMVLNDVNEDEGYPGQSGWPFNNNHYRIALMQAEGWFSLEQHISKGIAENLYVDQGIHNTTSPSTWSYRKDSVQYSNNALSIGGNGSASTTVIYGNSTGPQIVPTPLPNGTQGTPYNFSLLSGGGVSPIEWGEQVEVPLYSEASTLPSLFDPSSGVAQGWRANAQKWLLQLPFPFPFYDRVYSEVWVDCNGYIDLGWGESEKKNKDTKFPLLTRIAALWDNVDTAVTGGDIFVETTTADQVTIRWKGKHDYQHTNVNFAVVLFSDGTIRFDYGSGNTSLTPTIGISRGFGQDFELVSSHTGQSDLGDADSVEFNFLSSEIPPGLKIDASGTLSGTPTSYGTWSPQFRATDSGNRFDLLEFQIVIDFLDCNTNGQPDDLAIDGGGSQDCNTNGIPDECDLAGNDCNANGVPDECDTDCNSNGTPDACESITDCNTNGIPDECELVGNDCNTNGIPDECDLAANDCNNNGVPDACDITTGTSGDSDGSGVPDECEVTQYCSALQDSVGCNPTIGTSGFATLTGSDDFFITAGQVIGQSVGLLALSLNSNPPTSSGGGMGVIDSSPLGLRYCLYKPLAVGFQQTGGTAGNCSGTMSYHLSQSVMNSNGFVAGDTLHAQWLYADAGASNAPGYGHTMAIRFDVMP